MYATLAELKSRIDMTVADHDADLAALLVAAADSIDRACNRPGGFVADNLASSRIYTGSGGPIQTIDECTSITTVEVKDSASDTSYTTWAVTDWVAFGGGPRNPNFQPTVNNRPYTSLMIAPEGDYAIFTSGSYSTMRGFRPTFNVSRGVPTVKVTSKWGYSIAAPGVIQEANIVQAARWWKRGLEGWAYIPVAGGVMGQPQYQKILDPAILVMLRNGRFIRPALG